MYQHHRKESPRRIVLLSDGTGNSSAKLFKTNVWRMYQAIDLLRGDQIAYYNNGVGTSSIKVWALLTGAMGLGLRRNVLDLYRFACHNYAFGADQAPLDELFLFGFSRGAYTVRILAGLIGHQGLIQDERGRDLERFARRAYRYYRLSVTTLPHVCCAQRFALRIADLVDFLLRRKRYVNCRRLNDAKITFMGLWDTVDAYGLPVDEMTDGWNRWVWPLSLRDRNRLKNVDKICHALALDDERLSFHPVLYNERGEEARESTTDNLDDAPYYFTSPAVAGPTTRTINEEHISQVWFAGMHSDVGGGYPDDGLAHVSLCWMADEAAKRRLDLLSFVRDDWRSRADFSAPMHNSRRGLVASFYRYKPRRVEALSHDKASGVEALPPKIHESVFQRMVFGRDDYAPIVLPQCYDVVRWNGEIAEGSRSGYETGSQATGRAEVQERVWNFVLVRRWLYFLSLGTAICGLVLPLAPREFLQAGLGFRSQTVSSAVSLAATYLPDMTRRWTTYYRDRSDLLIVLGLFYGLLVTTSTRLERLLRRKMMVTWHQVLLGTATVEGSGPAGRATKWVRRVFGPNSLINKARVFSLIHGTGILSLAAVLLLMFTAANRALFLGIDLAGRTCPHATGRAPASHMAVGATAVVTVSNRMMCDPLGIWLDADVEYEASIALPQGVDDVWRDAGHIVRSPKGIATDEPFDAAYVVGIPARRLLATDWFVPVLRIGSRGLAEYVRLTDQPTKFRTHRSGEAFALVNDALGPPWQWDHFYQNNHGAPAVLTIRRLR